MESCLIYLSWGDKSLFSYLSNSKGATKNGCSQGWCHEGGMTAKSIETPVQEVTRESLHQDLLKSEDGTRKRKFDKAWFQAHAEKFSEGPPGSLKRQPMTRTWNAEKWHLICGGTQLPWWKTSVPAAAASPRFRTPCWVQSWGGPCGLSSPTPFQSSQENSWCPVKLWFKLEVVLIWSLLRASGACRLWSLLEVNLLKTKAWIPFFRVSYLHCLMVWSIVRYSYPLIGSYRDQILLKRVEVQLKKWDLGPGSLCLHIGLCTLPSPGNTNSWSLMWIVFPAVGMWCWIISISWLFFFLQTLWKSAHFPSSNFIFLLV